MSVPIATELALAADALLPTAIAELPVALAPTPAAKACESVA